MGRCVFVCVCVGGPVAKPFPIVEALRAGNQDGAELIGKPFLSYKWSRPYTVTRLEDLFRQPDQMTQY